MIQRSGRLRQEDQNFKYNLINLATQQCAASEKELRSIPSGEKKKRKRKNEGLKNDPRYIILRRGESISHLRPLC